MDSLHIHLVKIRPVAVVALFQPKHLLLVLSLHFTPFLHDFLLQILELFSLYIELGRQLDHLIMLDSDLPLGFNGPFGQSPALLLGLFIILIVTDFLLLLLDFDVHLLNLTGR